MRPFLAARFLSLLILAGTAAAATPTFSPVSAGQRAEVNARDGDAAFNVDYFANPTLSGPPVASRLEATVGGDGQAVPGRPSHGWSARWSGTLTPKVSGDFPFLLRAQGAAVLRVDGRVVLERTSPDAGSDAGRTTVLRLEAAKPYELVVELRSPGVDGRVSLEWAAPSAAAAAGPATAATRSERLVGPATGAGLGRVLTRENRAYHLVSTAQGDSVLREKATGAEAVFRPEFAVVFQAAGEESRMDAKGGKFQDPGPAGDTNYVVPSWDKETDFLRAAFPRTRLRAERITEAGEAIIWEFARQPRFRLRAELRLPAGDELPALRFEVEPTEPGQVSVGYVGAPETAPAEADWFWQPLVWTEGRFPNRSYLTKEFQCPLPWTMTSRGGLAVGVGADPREMPFRMPTLTDSRFGVLLRNAAGQAQPMLFAPVLGGPESRRAAGETYAFQLRLLVRKAGWYETYRDLGRSLYAFGDARENATCSLNTTIANLVAFLLRPEYSYWYADYKTWGYQNDGGADAGRQQSAADALAIGLVTDDPVFCRDRGLPTLEYMLSRRSLSTRLTDPRSLGGHVANATDLTAAYRLTGGRSTVIRTLLSRDLGGQATGRGGPGGRSPAYQARSELGAALAEFRLVGSPASLARARAAGDRYITERIDRPVADFRDVGSSFWHELAGAFDLLYELYQETRDPRHLAAAWRAAGMFTAYIYLVPVIPDASFTANPGGTYHGQPVPEEVVPAWRVAANGLTAECAGTAHSHRGVYMASHPAYFARLARDTGDTFLQDLARQAIVGRYANYPSYAYRNGYTTLHQHADYPLRTFEEIRKFTSAHYNHPLPMTAFLIDYLVSEAYLRSDGMIDFPSDYTNTGAFFRNRVYGARPGRFHGDYGVHLWLPAGLVTMESGQVNYVAGRGPGRFYLALANQSARPVTTSFQIDPARVRLAGPHRARVWNGRDPAGELTIQDGRGHVTIPPKGQVSLAIDGATVTTRLQEAMLDPSVPALPEGSSAEVRLPGGSITATALRLGRGLTTVHVVVNVDPSATREVRLAAADGVVLRRPTFPFEFTVPVPDDVRRFTAAVEVVDRSGRTAAAPAVTIGL